MTLRKLPIIDETFKLGLLELDVRLRANRRDLLEALDAKAKSVTRLAACKTLADRFVDALSSDDWRERFARILK